MSNNETPQGALPSDDAPQELDAAAGGPDIGADAQDDGDQSVTSQVKTPTVEKKIELAAHFAKDVDDDAGIVVIEADKRKGRKADDSDGGIVEILEATSEPAIVQTILPESLVVEPPMAKPEMSEPLMAAPAVPAYEPMAVESYGDAPADAQAAEHGEPALGPEALRTVVRYGLMRQIGEFRHNLPSPPPPNRKVVIRSERGVEIGETVLSVGEGCDPTCRRCIDRPTLTTYIQESGPEYPYRRDGKVLRLANAQDLIDQRHLDACGREEAMYCRQQIREMGLKMKLVTVEHLLGGERIIFYFSSEVRVDFRDLVRRLATQYRTRIEMRQVGARDEARLVGDYERCGQRCCCQQYLKDLKPVSMRMAKTQKATLDPSKISGRCGRLMCCLRYEDSGYEELRKKLPRKNIWVRTADNVVGRVIDGQIITQLVRLLLIDNTQVVVSNEDITERDIEAPVIPEREERRPPKERKERSTRLLRDSFGDGAQTPEAPKPEGRASDSRRSSDADRAADTARAIDAFTANQDIKDAAAGTDAVKAAMDQEIHEFAGQGAMPPADSLDEKLARELTTAGGDQEEGEEAGGPNGPGDDGGPRRRRRRRSRRRGGGQGAGPQGNAGNSNAQGNNQGGNQGSNQGGPNGGQGGSQGGGQGGGGNQGGGQGGGRGRGGRRNRGRGGRPNRGPQGGPNQGGQPGGSGGGPSSGSSGSGGSGGGQAPPSAN